MDKKEIKCYLCKKKSLKYYVQKQGTKYYKCSNCNLIQQLLIPEKNIINNIYDGNEVYFLNDNKGLNLKEATTIAYKQYFFYSIMKPYLKNKNIKILDIGAGTGLLLKLLKSKQYNNLEGVELSRWACNIAKNEFNLNVKNINIEEADFSINHFDLIIANHILEHLLKPINIFNKINSFLKPGGILFLSTPNGTCLNFRLVKKKWRHLIPNEHIFLFNEKSLKLFLKKTNFKLLELRKRLYSDGNLLTYIKKLLYPIFLDIKRKIRHQDPLNNFLTFRDGLITVSMKK